MCNFLVSLVQWKASKYCFIWGAWEKFSCLHWIVMQRMLVYLTGLCRVLLMFQHVMMGQFVYGWSQKRALLNQQMSLTQSLLDTLRKSTLSSFTHLQRMSWHQDHMTWQYESGTWWLRQRELYCKDTQTRYIYTDWTNRFGSVVELYPCI
jgi:hypothetical protein